MPVSRTVRASRLQMSECTAHSNMAWRGAGHRHVLRVGFKPAHIAHPEENFTDEQIMSLPPEIRELRKFAPLNQIKSIAEPGRGPVTISEPNGAPVTDDERTHGPPSASVIGTAKDAMPAHLKTPQVPHLPFENLSPKLPPVRNPPRFVCQASRMRC